MGPRQKKPRKKEPVVVHQPVSTTAYSEDLQYSVENDLLIPHEDHSLTFFLFRYPFLVLVANSSCVLLL